MRKQTSFLFFSPVHAKNKIYLFLRYPEPRTQWKFGFLVENPSSSAGSQCFQTIRSGDTSHYLNLLVLFLPADETGTKDAREKALWRDHEENLLRPVRSWTGIFFLNVKYTWYENKPSVGVYPDKVFSWQSWFTFASQDHNAAFKSKTTMEVLRALVVFQLCGINKLVDNNEMVSFVIDLIHKMSPTKNLTGI